MDSGLDGKFIGVLPRTGWWRVEIAAAEPKLETAAKVKVEADGKDEARVEIDLPATRVFGKVLDDSGRPLPRASFTLSTDQGFVFAETDEAGSFELRGAAEGMAFAAATYSAGPEEWTSDRISLLLRDGDDVGPLEVRLRRNKRFTGRVQSPAGPLPGAGVWVQPLRPAMMAGASVRSDVDGTFTASVPAAAEALAVIVSPPGHALQAFAATPGAVPALTVGLDAGSVGVLFPDPETQDGSAMSFWLFQNGLPIPTQVLYQWTIGHGQEITRTNAGRLRLPAMAPGEYRACLAAQAVLVSWEASGWTAPLAKCASGQLSAGGELNLDLSSAAEKPGSR
jgi:hypothetical protein